MQFKIYEENMERLEKKLTRIANKCQKYGNDFRYEVIGEEFKEQHDEYNRTEILRYVIVEVEGKAIINNWQFVASLEHTGQGNIIRSCCDIEVPERYYTCAAVCEHCNSNRHRKNTYIIYNTVTGEFKQVGKSCLMDFTGGMDAEYIASYISTYDELIRGESVEPGCYRKPYIRTKEAMQYIAETIQHFGYVKSDNEKSTKVRAANYYKANNGIPVSSSYEVKLEMRDIGFNKDSEYAVELTEKVINWSGKQSEDNTYFHNLKTVCALAYTSFDKFGILASVFPDGS